MLNLTKIFPATDPAPAPPDPLTWEWLCEVGPPLEPVNCTSREFLDNNAPPAEIHISFLEEYLSRGTMRRTCIDSKIAILRAALDNMVAERDRLEADMRKHEGAISVMRRLPTEILSLIFSFVPTNQNLLDHRTTSGGPWSISTVCSRWRSIALAQPSLWTDICLDFASVLDLHFGRKGFASSGKASKLEAHLERSAQLPLAVEFYSVSSDAGGRIIIAEYDALRILEKHCHRWETISMTGPDLLFSTSTIDGNLPLLRALHVNIFPALDNDVEVTRLKLFQNCPSLRVATVNANENAIFTSISLELPFNQLLQYKSGNSRGQHLNALRLTSNLVDCVLYVDREDTLSWQPNTPRVHLPNLLRLSVSHPDILDNLDTPRLRELYCAKPCDALLLFFHRSPSLQKLVFRKTLDDPQEAISLLHGAPKTLSYLGLYLNGPLAGQILSALTASSSVRAMQRLTTVSLGFRRVALPNNEFEDLALRMIESHLPEVEPGGDAQGYQRRYNLYCRPRRLPVVPSLEMFTGRRMEVLQEQGVEVCWFPGHSSFAQAVFPEYFIPNTPGTMAIRGRI